MANKVSDEILSKIDEKIDDLTVAIHKVDKEVALQKASFDEHTKQDERMYEELRRMNDILQQNTESLKEHMHRTELLEDIVKKMDARLNPIELEKIEKEAIKKYHDEKIEKWVKFGKVAGAIAAIVTIVTMMKPIFIKLLGL